MEILCASLVSNSSDFFIINWCVFSKQGMCRYISDLSFLSTDLLTVVSFLPLGGIRLSNKGQMGLICRGLVGQVCTTPTF